MNRTPSKDIAIARLDFESAWKPSKGARDKTWKGKMNMKINKKRIETSNGGGNMEKKEKHKGSGIRI